MSLPRLAHTSLLAGIPLAIVLLSELAAADIVSLSVDSGQFVQARIDLVDVSSTHTLPLIGYLTADVTLTDDGNGGQYVSSFQALGGVLELASGTSTQFILYPPTTSCYGASGEACEAGGGFCVETVGGTPGYSTVVANLDGLSLTAGGAQLAATLTVPGESTFPLFDPETPNPDDNFKLTTLRGIFTAGGCALNQEVLQSNDFNCGVGCDSDFWGFTGDATAVYDGGAADPLQLTLPLNHNLLVIGWLGDDNYGIMNLSGDVHFVPEPGGLAALSAGALLLGWLRERRGVASRRGE